MTGSDKSARSEQLKSRILLGLRSQCKINFDYKSARPLLTLLMNTYSKPTLTVHQFTFFPLSTSKISPSWDIMLIELSLLFLKMCLATFEKLYRS